MEWYSDLYDLMERFSIMTESGKMSDSQCLEYLKDKTSPELLRELEDKIWETVIKGKKYDRD